MSKKMAQIKDMGRENEKARREGEKVRMAADKALKVLEVNLRHL